MRITFLFIYLIYLFIYLFIFAIKYISLVVRIPVFRASDQARHKPGCAATEDNQRPEISNLGCRGIVLSKTKAPISFAVQKKNRPSHDDK